MKRKRRITRCYYEMFLDRFKIMLDKIVRIECGRDWEEYVSIAYEQLLYVMIHFDQFKYPQVNKGSFSTFTYIRVSGILRHALKRTLRYNRIELFENSRIDDENFYVTDIELPMFIKELMEKLTPRQRDVIYGYFLESKTLNELGKEKDLSPCTIAKDKDKAIEKIRRLVTA